MPLDTSADSPVPVRTVLQLVGGWISRLGRVWVEGQIAELAVRGGAVFLTLRDPVAAVSVRVICSRLVFDAAEPPPADGAVAAPADGVIIDLDEHQPSVN